MATRQEIFKAKTLEQLQALERKYGYSYGWANRVHEARRRKHDRVDRGGKAGNALAEKTPHKAQKNEWNGAAGLARQADLFAANTILD